MKKLQALLLKSPYRFRCALGLVILLLSAPFHIIPVLLLTGAVFIKELLDTIRAFLVDLRWFTTRLIKGEPKKDG